MTDTEVVNLKVFGGQAGRNGANHDVTILSVSPTHEDWVCLARLLSESASIFQPQPRWILVPCVTPESALAVLREEPWIPIVVCDCDVSPDSWRELLEKSALLPDPPFLIVASRLADERLWAEALNLGAYDVLAKPFDKEEVVRILSSAWLHWSNEHEFAAGRKP